MFEGLKKYKPEIITTFTSSSFGGGAITNYLTNPKETAGTFTLAFFSIAMALATIALYKYRMKVLQEYQQQ